MCQINSYIRAFRTLKIGHIVNCPLSLQDQVCNRKAMCAASQKAGEKVGFQLRAEHSWWSGNCRVWRVPHSAHAVNRY